MKSLKKFWTKDKDQHLRDNYNDKVKTDPAQLALRLIGSTKSNFIALVENRLSKLKLRNKRHNPEKDGF